MQYICLSLNIFAIDLIKNIIIEKALIEFGLALDASYKTMTS